MYIARSCVLKSWSYDVCFLLGTLMFRKMWEYEGIEVSIIYC
jgi:hypothetical protein